MRVHQANVHALHVRSRASLDERGLATRRACLVGEAPTRRKPIGRLKLYL